MAACASKVSGYQRNFQFYEDNTKKTLLSTLDEHAVRLLLWLQWEYRVLLRIVLLTNSMLCRSDLRVTHVGRNSFSRKSPASS